METLGNSPIEDMKPTAVIPVAEFQHRLDNILKQLSPERLQAVADFAAYLAHADSEAAT